MAAKLRAIGRIRLSLIFLALLLIGLSWAGALAPRKGLTVRSLSQDGVPMRFMVPRGAADAPGVIIAHGFGVSQQIMLGYGYSLAHAGYGVLLLDFEGHGRSPAPFDRGGNALRRNLDSAYQQLIRQPEIDPARVGLLGHSMGSGAAMGAGIDHPERYQAVVAASPTGAEVTPELPRNLFMQAGQWEPRFVTNAEELLARAGGPNSDFAAGLARSMVTIPRAEHILILFSPDAHSSAVNWFNRAFGRDTLSSYTDRRALNYAITLAGWMILLLAAAPLLPQAARPPADPRRRPWHLLGLALFPFVAATLTAAADKLVPLASLGGIMVGGAAALYFGFMGLGWLLAGFRPSRPALNDLFWGGALFAFQWIAFGAMIHLVLLNWLLVPARLIRWPFMAALFLPWLLAAGYAQQGASPLARLGWWLGQTAAICAGIFLAVQMVPSLSVLILAMPMLPIVFGLMAISSAAVQNPWANGVGNALFFGWLILSYFPYGG